VADGGCGAVPRRPDRRGKSPRTETQRSWERHLCREGRWRVSSSCAASMVGLRALNQSPPWSAASVTAGRALRELPPWPAGELLVSSWRGTGRAGRGDPLRRRARAAPVPTSSGSPVAVTCVCGCSHVEFSGLLVFFNVNRSVLIRLTLRVKKR
jgi:hypothetical protein